MKISLRSILLFCAIAAAVTALLTIYNPWFDDSTFVRDCVSYKGRTAKELMDFVSEKDRKLTPQRNVSGTLVGLSVYARDGQMVYLSVGSNQKLGPVSQTWSDSQFLNSTITSVQTYKVKQIGGRTTISPTKVYASKSKN